MPLIIRFANRPRIIRVRRVGTRVEALVKGLGLESLSFVSWITNGSSASTPNATQPRPRRGDRISPFQFDRVRQRQRWSRTAPQHRWPRPSSMSVPRSMTKLPSPNMMTLSPDANGIKFCAFLLVRCIPS